MGYLKPLPQRVPRGQRFGENPGLGPNPAGGHNGDDYKSWVGEPIYAAGDGEVIHAGTFDSTYADNFGWNLNYGGNMVVLNLDGDTAPYVEYGHMDKIYVQPGQRVRRGQVIGTTGATDGGTGVISGPHLHVGCLPPNFNLNTNTYGRVNPDLYLTDYPDETGTINVQSESITPVQEDDMATVPQDEWEWAKQVLTALSDNAATKKDLAGVPQAVVTAQVPYKDPVTGQDTGQTTSLATMAGFADFQATATRALVLQGPAGIASQINAAGLAAQVRDELVKLLGGK